MNSNAFMVLQKETDIFSFKLCDLGTDANVLNIVPSVAYKTVAKIKLSRQHEVFKKVTTKLYPI